MISVATTGPPGSVAEAGGFALRRPPVERRDQTLTSVEVDISVPVARVAELTARAIHAGMVPIRGRRPDGHRAFVALDGDRWVKLDGKLDPAPPSGRSWLRTLCSVLGAPRGPMVAIVGPDGAGKTTVIESLRAGIPAQVRVHYLGRGDRSRKTTRGEPVAGPGPGERAPVSMLRECLFVVRWALKDRVRLQRARLDARLGAVVLCDRHPIEALAARRRHHDIAHRLERLVTPSGRSVDAFVLLGGDPVEMYRRKREHDVATAERTIKALRNCLPPTAAEVVGTDEPARVAAEVSHVVWDAWCRRVRPFTRAEPLLGEVDGGMCVIVDPAGAGPDGRWSALRGRWTISRQMKQGAGTGFEVEEVALRPGPTGRRGPRASSRRLRDPVAFRLRTGRQTEIDRVVAAAGLGAPRSLRLGAGRGFTMIASHNGRQALARVGRLATPADPSHHAAGLSWAAAHGVGAPALLDQGRHGDHRWSVEELVRVGVEPPGSPVWQEVAIDWATRLIAIERRDLPAGMPGRQLEHLTGLLPRYRDQLEVAMARHRPVLEQLGSAPCHGDLWSANIGWIGGTLVALDWDAWCRDAVPGLDLVHVWVEAERRARRLSLGVLVGRRPWLEAGFAPGLETVIGPGRGPADLEATALAAWLNAVTNALRRTPDLRWSRRWLAENLLLPIETFGPG